MNNNQKNRRDDLSLNGMYDPYNDIYRQQMNNQNRGFSVASLVLGIISIVCCCLTYLALGMAVLAIIFAIVSKMKNDRFDGMAIAGLVCGIIGFSLTMFDIIVSIAFADYLAQAEAELLRELEELEALEALQ